MKRTLLFLFVAACLGLSADSYASGAPDEGPVAVDEPAIGGAGDADAIACEEGACLDDAVLDGPWEEGPDEDLQPVWSVLELSAGEDDTYSSLNTLKFPPGVNVCHEAYAALQDEDRSYTEGDYPEVPVVVNKNVVAFINYFQTRGRKYFEKWLGRTSDYMVTVTEILREEGLPEDLFYIALIESGLSPNARSRANAVGMWQFIRGTAMKYGLRVDWWIDERRDPEKATRAAARYFKNLYGEFGSWYLAAAGYNAGEGRIRSAVRRSGSDDFWVLASRQRGLKRETRDYVPKYLAAMLIAKDPESYGFEDPGSGASLAYEKVKVPYATDIRLIAGAAGTTVAEIQRLNPELLRWFTPPNYPDYEIKLPRGSSERYYENIGKIPPAERVKFLQHKVRRGETLSTIAARYGTPIKQILYLNDIKNPRSIRPGAVIVVPVRGKENGKRIADAVPVHWGRQG